MKLAVLLCALLCSTHAYSINRCVIDGKVTYQDAPCKADLGTVGDAIKRRDQEKQEQQAREASEVASRALSDPCKGKAFDERYDAYVKANPHKKHQIDKAMHNGAYVGMPEDALDVLICGDVDQRNITQTAAGNDMQIVLRSTFSSLAKYIYVRNGVVYAIQK